MLHFSSTFRPFAAGALVVGLLAGCTATREELSVGHRDPSIKIPGMKRAVRMQDDQAVRQLVKDLDSDDPAVRFYAINALRRLTGKDLEYRYYHTETERRPALARWNDWLNEPEAGALASDPAPASPTNAPGGGSPAVMEQAGNP